MSGVPDVPRAQPAVLTVAGLAVIVAYVGLLLWATAHTSYDTWGVLVVGPVLLLLTLPLARHVARAENDPMMVRLLLLALAVKLAASLVRYFVAFEVYGGSADAKGYVNAGKKFAELFYQGVFSVDGGGGSRGTVSMRYISGVVIALVGPTALGAFLVFSWLGYWGLYFFYRAFRIGVPGGDGRRYALLVFFLPSLLFWPSSPGKEAWMLLTLGLASYGAARILARLPGGYPIAALGVGGAVLVREHMAALVCASLFAAFVLRPGGRVSTLGPLARVPGTLLLLAGLLVVVQQAEERFGVEDSGGGLSGVEQAIDSAAERTSKGGSEFEASRPDSPLELPWAAFTVLFRPLPHEAHNAQALAASLEGLALLGLFTLSLPRLAQLPRMAWRHPYVLFAICYALLFVVAFSSFGNFGILARQRSQFFPLVLVLLALPYARPAPPRWRAANYGPRQRALR